MTPEQYHEFVEQACAELDQKQLAFREQPGVARSRMYWFDQTSSRLSFQDEAGQLQLQADALPIGSYSLEHRTWQWAWANESLLDPLRERAAALQKLADYTGQEAYRTAVLQVDEGMPRRLAAVSVNWLGAIGYCAIPVGRLRLYLAVQALQPDDNGRSA